MTVTAASVEQLETAAQRLHMGVDELTQLLLELTDSRGRATPLASSARLELTSSSGISVDDLENAEVEAAEDTHRARVSQQITLLSESVSTAEAATRLDIGDSAVRQRIRKKQLWAPSIGREHRIPRWQFVATVDARDDPASSESLVFDVVLSDTSEPAVQGPVTLVDVKYLPGDDTRRAVLTLLYDAPRYRWVSLPGLEKVVAAIPSSATPAAINSFMTSAQEGLLLDGTPVSPVRWLAIGRDPAAVVGLLEQLDIVW